jgi:hypothetical protein
VLDQSVGLDLGAYAGGEPAQQQVQSGRIEGQGREASGGREGELFRKGGKAYKRYAQFQWPVPVARTAKAPARRLFLASGTGYWNWLLELATATGQAV